MTDQGTIALDKIRRRKRKKKSDYKKSSNPQLKAGRLNSSHELKVKFHPSYRKHGKIFFSYFTDPKTEIKSEKLAIKKLLSRVLRGSIKGQFEYANLYVKGGTSPLRRFNSEGIEILDSEFQKKKSDSKVAQPTPLFKLQFLLHQDSINTIRSMRKEVLHQAGVNLPSNIDNLNDKEFNKLTLKQVRQIKDANPIAKLGINSIINSIDMKDGKRDMLTGFLFSHSCYLKALTNKLTCGMVKAGLIYKQDFPIEGQSTWVATFDYNGRIKWKDKIFKAQIGVMDKEGALMTL